MVNLIELIDVDYKIKVDSRGKYKAHTDDQLIIAVSARIDQVSALKLSEIQTLNMGKMEPRGTRINVPEA